eukprot:TRINITY_DN982_c0_g1_i1.p1 TRINITY_DN982_c0_g1~~TRINITY_DN982_c0_g1_i1.p1  ORF type:complete len:369 (+),score=64.24 TRINITY_DN982_c0_g1_i1:315-1421(+)
MGNISSSRRRQDHHQTHRHNRPPPALPSSPPPASASYVFAANAPYTPHVDPYHTMRPQVYYSPYPSGPPTPPPQAWPYGVRPPPPPAAPPAWPNGASPSPSPSPLPPYVEHHKTTTIRNDVNLRRETLRLERDEQNPDCFLVAFNFDSMVSGSISIFFFAKEGMGCSLTALRPDICPPIKIPFEKGLGQKFCQPSGSGIDLSFFEESELTKVDQDEVFPLVIRAEASASQTLDDVSNGELIGNPLPKSVNSQITQAVFEKKDNGEYRVKVVKQILWVDGTRYELQEIYGIGSSAGSDFDSNDPGKECVICMSEPRDTTVLPCRHMCMCGECAKLLRMQTNRCPICRRPVERLMEIKVNKDEELEEGQP